jgi:hypothetical protein
MVKERTIESYCEQSGNITTLVRVRSPLEVRLLRLQSGFEERH